MRLSPMRLIMYLYMKERSLINEYHTTRKRTNQASLLHVNQGISCFPSDQPDLIVEELTPTKKLGVSSSIEAVTKALQMGYIAPL